MRKVFVILAAVALMIPTLLGIAAEKGTEEKALELIDGGLKWLSTQQEKDGSYRHNIGITGLVVTAFLKHPKGKYTEENSPLVKKAIEYIVKHQNEDGSIYDKKSEMPLPNYETSIAVMALVAAGKSKYEEIITKAQKWLAQSQLDEGEGISPDDPRYGGIGYGSSAARAGTKRGDMSNLNFAVQALKESGFPEDDPLWEKVVKFIERCQNYSETNDQPWAGNDGGFVYAPDGESKAEKDESGRPRSYASMTYAGLLSFIYANVDKNDPRVQAAVKWIKEHYTLDENPPIGKQGLFYNYHTMAKALAAYGERIIEDYRGIKHDWYAELVDKLASLQNPEGFWVNEADRWMESDPVLVTAYSVLALEVGFPKASRK
jgi:squalene-hopene/tetraprenyl-beta-curcumene cyclase